jgi:hypothetical protein
MTDRFFHPTGGVHTTIKAVKDARGRKHLYRDLLASGGDEQQLGLREHHLLRTLIALFGWTVATNGACAPVA